ncbi:MAG: DUF6036 family nucleotidyltransferase [Vulcanimicrobiota bacterium]
MNRPQLEHVLRAAGAIAETSDLIVIGSQAVLGWSEAPPNSLLQSIEVDLYPRDTPALADLIDGSIGELSPFHETFGYYAHGVHPATAILPNGWKQRLIPLNNENTQGVTGWCLHPLDIAISKLVAGRPKDLEYVSALISFAELDESALDELARTLDEPESSQVLGRLNRLRG